MAEFAELSIQNTVPEVEEMERLGLLSAVEIKALITKRRELEYRVARMSKNKEDYITAINYEKKLLELLKLRRKEIRVHEKYQQIEGAIKLRVVKRCRLLTRYWPHHFDTWAMRINFAQAFGWKSEVTISYAEQIRYHGQRESVYISWARFEIEERDNFDMARKILLSKAPLYHKKSPLIKREHFRLELLFVESLKKKIAEDKAITEIIKENREKVLKCEIPRAVYKDAVKEIPDPQLYLDLYQVASKFSFASDLEDEIYRDLLEAFPNSECLWKLKAQRIALGLEPLTKKENEDVKAPKKKLFGIDRLRSTITIFNDAVNSVGKDFVVSYLEELLLMLHECWSDNKMKTIVIEKIVSLCEEHKSVLTPVHYLIWYHVLHHLSESSSVLRGVLEDAVAAYPDVEALQLEYFKHILSLDLSDEEKLKEFNKAAASLKGVIGLQIWDAVLESLKDDNNKVKLYQSALYHHNETICKGLRVRYLKWLTSNKGMKAVRKLYKDIAMKPPFSSKLHAVMISAELSKKNVSANDIRSTFHNAVQQHGAIQPGVWLSLIHFEKTSGSPLKTGGLYTRAENELEAKYADTFRQLNLIIRDMQSKKEAGTASSGEEVWVTGKDSEAADIVQRPPVVRLFDEELIVTFTVDQQRKNFFAILADMKKLVAKGNPEAPKEDGSVWEDVLEHLLGNKISLNIQQVTVKEKSVQDYKDEIETELTNSRRQKKYELSDHLDPGQEEDTNRKSGNDLDKILESSLTLKPEFMKQTQLSPYFVRKKKAKALRRIEKQKTKGPGWFDMKAPELTEEAKRDLQVLQMRPVLDPKRPFKNKDMKVVPKYFQMGKVIETPFDFYSSRIPKKKRKRTIAEEIMNDEEALRYQKRKYNQIVKERTRQSKRSRLHGVKQKKGKTKK